MTNVALIVTPGSATVSYKGNTKTYSAGTPEYDKVKEFMKADDEQSLIDLLTKVKKVVEDAYGKQGFRVSDDVVFVKNEDGTEDSLPRVLGQRVVEFANEELPYQPLLNFYRELNENPSYTVRQRLYEFLEANHHPICEDGRFLAYKKVRPDFKDIYSGKFDNSPGNVVEVKRNQVDEDPEKTCSFGLHCAAFSYAATSYGSSSDTLLEVKVSPKDCVAIPKDYNSQKLRVCKYEVVQVCKEENKSNLYGYVPPVTDDDEDDCGCDCDCDDNDSYDDDDCICDDYREDFDDCACGDDDEEFDDEDDE